MEVDLGVLESNIRELRGALGGETETIFVVKADAYGHGIRETVRRAYQAGVRWFAVAYADEARVVREVLPEAEVLILGVVMPEDAARLAHMRVTPIVADVEHGLALAAAARAAGTELTVHVKVDTGMGRLGVLWSDAVEAVMRLLDEPGLNVQGLCSHFARVEPMERGPAEKQAQRFFETASALEQAAGRRFFRHLSSSRALLYHHEWDLDGVRPGIMLYGYGTGEEGMRVHTRPLLEWKTRVIHVKAVPPHFPIGYYGTYRTHRATEIAVLAAGYADGYLRALSNRGTVLIGGRRCPVVGRVSMNWITVDVGPGGGVKRGDEAVLIGRQGAEEVWADELAALCRTIPYEILTEIDPRLERRYVG